MKWTRVSRSRVVARSRLVGMIISKLARFVHSILAPATICLMSPGKGRGCLEPFGIWRGFCEPSGSLPAFQQWYAYCERWRSLRIAWSLCHWKLYLRDQNPIVLDLHNIIKNVGRMLNCKAWTALAKLALKIPDVFSRSQKVRHAVSSELQFDKACGDISNSCWMDLWH